MCILFFFFFNRRYNPWWVLACYLVVVLLYYHSYSRKNYAGGIGEGGVPKGEQVTGVWRNLHDKNLRDLYASPNITRLITGRGMRLAGHVSRV